MGVGHFTYLAVLGFIAICAVVVNFLFRIQIVRQWKVFLKVDLLLIALYGSWDVWAANRKAWYFDDQQILGLKIFGVLPIEEILFFILVPLMVLISLQSLEKIIEWVKTR